MKVTYMRIQGKKPTPEQLSFIIADLTREFNDAGFITSVDATSSTGLNIGLGGKCFTVDTGKLGYNALTGFYTMYGGFIDRGGIKGYTRTAIPTWDQRVKFNDILNKILDAYEVTCNIKSGPFIIRDRENGGYSEDDWESQVPDGQWSYCVDRIVELTPDMVAEGKERLKEHRKEQARLKKERMVQNITHLQGKSSDDPCFI